MTRSVLSAERRTPLVDQAIASFHEDVVRTVQQAVEKNPVVVVGMALNPHVIKVRKALTDAGVPFTYLEFGGYWSQWKQRLAIKLWSGWPTFPQVFVKGALIGGGSDTIRALKDGSLKKLLQGP
ncbi:MAG TPA: glutaredoxin domain-containing protein [Oligoflexus sp.]|uniref:glutaredoxin domain-containing protein n=1 Tax=Oligoflexus sp. TaxID=1971216 RepID=UPI002D72E096|nr:glutaredoxin domain-containing protein [Oligoflexus sp.]HYX38471.1 glutaredoxin domain-containing protein [Oligoflexus sp.]